MAFSREQTEAIQIRGKNIIVSASAGSGKTSVLVERLCQLVTKDQISIDSILSMTFTNDAAREMKDRLKKALQDCPKTEYIEKQLILLETASICTIDSFCQSIVKDYYYKIPISYTMSQTVGSSAQIDDAFKLAYQKAIEDLEIDEAFRLNQFFNIYGKNENDIQTLINKIIDVANAKSDSQLWFQNNEAMYSNFDSNNLKYFFAYFKERIQAMIDILNYMLDEMDSISFEKEKDYTKNVNLFLLKKDKLEDCLVVLENNNYDEFKFAFKTYIQATKNMPGTINKIKYTSVKDEFLKYQDSISDVLFDFDIFKNDLQNNIEIIKILLTVCKNTKEYFAQEKRKLEIIDFNDMEHFTLQLLNDETIQEELRNKYEMILVDEFQDTNELQESIISKFSRINNVFRVGDIKQSIYGFRQANPNIMKNHMKNENEYNKTLILDKNFRSNNSIIQFNNDFYQKIMNTDLLGKQFEDIDIAYPGLDEQKAKKQYPVRFLYTEIDTWNENQEEKINFQKAKALHEKNRYDIIANDILKQIKSGRKFKDICILLRSRTKQEELKECLEAYDIPVFASINSGFFTNSAVQIVISVLNACLNPNDDIHLVACLCSPLFHISKEQLAQACMTKEKYCTIYNHCKNMDFLTNFIEFRKSLTSSVTDCIQKIYRYNNFYYQYTSSQDKTNLDYLLEKAVSFLNQNNVSKFIQYLEEESKMDKTGQASSFGKEENVVKIMTMHASKGLQFPVVYILSQHSTSSRFENGPVLIHPDLGIALASIDTKNKKKRTSLYQLANKTLSGHDDLMEEMRILYVATTRAKEELIFVDCIKNENEFNFSLNTRALLNKKSYTSWLFHTYKQDTNGLVTFVKINDLYQRPETKQISSTEKVLPVYNRECSSLSSQTASGKKVKLEWPDFQTNPSIATDRGTLFHEMSGQCSFPYKKEEVNQYASQNGYTMKDIDFIQLLSLNNCKEYCEYMTYPHQYELSYIVKEDESVVHGFMDLVVWMPDKTIILDFKTDTVENENDLINRYKVQLDTYKDSYLKIDASKPVECVIYSFHLKKLINL